mgnify:CR=1 FL=1
MIIERNLKNKEIVLKDDTDKVILELSFVPSFFVATFRDLTPIVIRQEDDLVFYNNLKWLMSNSYEFSHEYSKKSDNELIWFSEQCFNINDKNECDFVSRLIIKYVNGEFCIYSSNPFFEKLGISNDRIVSFSPAGNGFWSKNLQTGKTLQDDTIEMFYNTLEQKIIDKGLERTRSISGK